MGLAVRINHLRDPSVAVKDAADQEAAASGVGPAGAQQHKRRAVAVFVIPGPDLAELNVATHGNHAGLGS